MKDHAKHLTFEELTAEIRTIKENLKNGVVDEETKARDDYFNDPANAAEIIQQQARMDLVIALYNARKAAGLTQKQLAEMIGTKQAYVADLERGRKNITFSTLLKYAAACGKKVAVNLL